MHCVRCLRLWRACGPLAKTCASKPVRRTHPVSPPLSAHKTLSIFVKLLYSCNAHTQESLFCVACFAIQRYERSHRQLLFNAHFAAARPLFIITPHSTCSWRWPHHGRRRSTSPFENHGNELAQKSYETNSSEWLAQRANPRESISAMHCAGSRAALRA